MWCVVPITQGHAQQQFLLIIPQAFHNLQSIWSLKHLIVYLLKMTALTNPELIAHKANCHCGAVIFTVRLPPLSSLEFGACNCSICTRNGYIMAYASIADVEYHTGADNLSEFRFAREVGVHKFCKTCGSSICGEMKVGDVEMVAINVSISFSRNLTRGWLIIMDSKVRLFQDIDLKTLKLQHSDRKQYGGGYEYPKFPIDSGITPSDPTLVPYQGNCQCKAVTYTAYLPSLHENEVNECTCSICITNGYILAYSKPSDVVFHTGRENLVRYTFKRHLVPHHFCKSCGSSIYLDRSGVGKGDFGMNVRIFLIGKNENRWFSS